jgi:hypothetical protein
VSLGHVLAIKLERTDTTLDLSQKAVEEISTSSEEATVGGGTTYQRELKSVGGPGEIELLCLRWEVRAFLITPAGLSFEAGSNHSGVGLSSKADPYHPGRGSTWPPRGIGRAEPHDSMEIPVYQAPWTSTWWLRGYYSAAPSAPSAAS